MNCFTFYRYGSSARLHVKNLQQLPILSNRPDNPPTLIPRPPTIQPLPITWLAPTPIPELLALSLRQPAARTRRTHEQIPLNFLQPPLIIHDAVVLPTESPIVVGIVDDQLNWQFLAVHVRRDVGCARREGVAGHDEAALVLVQDVGDAVDVGAVEEENGDDALGFVVVESRMVRVLDVQCEVVRQGGREVLRD